METGKISKHNEHDWFTLIVFTYFSCFYAAITAF